jgi:hypothetical protein
MPSAPHDDRDDGADRDDRADVVGEVSRRAGIGRVEAASWAVAARDCALERGDAAAAARFTQQARAAIDAVLATGVTPAELADELDYPGGADDLDGPHIDHHLTSLHHNNGIDRPPGCAGSAAAGLVATASVAADSDTDDAARRDQLTRWHHDDHATDHTDRTTGCSADLIGHDGRADAAGRDDPWSR